MNLRSTNRAIETTAVPPSHYPAAVSAGYVPSARSESGHDSIMVWPRRVFGHHRADGVLLLQRGVSAGGIPGAWTTGRVMSFISLRSFFIIRRTEDCGCGWFE